MNNRFIPTIQHYIRDDKHEMLATVRHSLDDTCNLCKADGMPEIKIREAHWKGGV